MRYLNRIAALAGISLAACGGGTPDPTPAAIAEATKALESAKIPVANAYASNNRAFPTTANSPIPIDRPASAKYVSAISYSQGSASVASVVVTLGGTGNPNVDGNFLGMFGIGQSDGTVTWRCGTAASAGSTSSAAVQGMYPYLPAACQN